ncbi:HAD family hydrolase [Oculatella sp. LEGE 06141]|uniref:HAD family hydrolase n=1 Tax=Oculatella sp. LEGE 06141 TaxID=1828648 RepID=UPI00187DED59|nr:HAD family hydrolase [Oculatella sp. LEGE 06141]MBE9182588.1 HAD family hydrolase [Oculatella sp. LEGE 06141]
MTDHEPDILAIDFDGVICDGLVEYFQTAWRAYCRIWSPVSETPPDGLAQQFYRMRPVVETGWEMPVVLRSLLAGLPEEAILADWPTIVQQQIAADGLDARELGAMVDRVRDEWIAADVDHWLSQHRFYPGVVERLQQTMNSAVHPVIITTKEGRFVRQLLQQKGVILSQGQIWGKESKQPKAQTLRDLMQAFRQETNAAAQIWFIEDRLKTLQGISAQPDLTEVRLYLADWGYNTAGDRATAEQDTRIRLLSLAQLAQAFSAWN